MSLTVSFREMWGLAVVLAIVAIPLAAATVISFRSYRRGWWLALPWGLLLLISVLVGGVLVSQDMMAEGSGGGGTIAVALILGGWISGAIHLLALAIAGPKLPAVSLKDVF